MKKLAVEFPVAPDYLYLLLIKIYKENKEIIENNIALIAIVSKFISPGLFVKTYLQKFNPIMN